MNVQCSLIQELMLYEFKLCHDVVEAIIFCMKSEDTLDLCMLSR